jgi:hypothetical protein
MEPPPIQEQPEQRVTLDEQALPGSLDSLDSLVQLEIPVEPEIPAQLPALETRVQLE